MARPELARFLRDRREALRPADVGLPGGPRRRTPGLRREEVAERAGMSADYYARLEQARGPHPSPGILDAVCDALKLGPAERLHLFRLAGSVPAAPSGPPRRVRPHIAGLLSRLPGTAVVVTAATYDVIAWNPLAEALLGPQRDRNLARRRFLGDGNAATTGPDPITASTGTAETDPGRASTIGIPTTALTGTAETDPSRASIIEISATAPTGTFGTDPSRASIMKVPNSSHAPEFAEIVVTRLRGALVRYPHDPGLRALVGQLRAGSEEFRGLWAASTVRLPTHQVKTPEHPVLGRLRLNCDVLAVPEDDQQVVFITADPGSRSERALRHLSATVTVSAS